MTRRRSPSIRGWRVRAQPTSGGDATDATLKLRIVPRAGRTAFAGRRGDAFVIRLAAPPVDGAANDALIQFLAASFDRPRRDISIVAGEKSRDKRVRIAGVSADELERRLAGLIGDSPSLT